LAALFTALHFNCEMVVTEEEENDFAENAIETYMNASQAECKQLEQTRQTANQSQEQFTLFVDSCN
jgi:hypothetical protein